jgi:hypothetical protein
MYDLDTDAVQARRTLEDWITYLTDDDNDVELSTWDDIYEVIVLDFISGGDYVEFVTEVNPFPEDDTTPTHRASYLDLSNGPD